MMKVDRSMPARKHWRSQRPMLCKLFHRPIQSHNMPPCLADNDGLVALGWQVSMLYITAVLPQAWDCLPKQARTLRVTRSQTRQALRPRGLTGLIEQAHMSRAEDVQSEQDTPEQAQTAPRQALSALLAVLYDIHASPDIASCHPTAVPCAGPHSHRKGHLQQPNTVRKACDCPESCCSQMIFWL